MISNSSTLPDDPILLKQIIAQYETEVRLLREHNRHLYQKLFGPKSEKYQGESPQLPLFDMPEPDPEAEQEEKTPVSGHSRKKPGRKPLPPSLPRVDVIHDIPEDEKVCGCGEQLVKIGEELSEKLDIIPAVIQVIRNIRPKYACRRCEGVENDGPVVKIAPPPPHIIPKGIATSGLLAHIFTAKFADALPFYRQEGQFRRLGVEIGRATMCNWAMKVAEACAPLLKLLQEDIRSGPLINIDETTLQVLKEPGRSPTNKSYMWVFRGGDPQVPSLIYQYSPSRAGELAKVFLGDYQGVVQTDGYSGYDFLDNREGVLHVGCWAHARRQFVEAEKARGKKAKPGAPTVAINAIKGIYAIEKKAKKLNLSQSELRDLRAKEAKPILDDLKTWLDTKSTQVVPKSLLGKAVTYSLNQWDRLTAYLYDGCVIPDNNLVENAIRPFTVGRKNWLFAGTQRGAEASAALYSLIETAKANGLDVYKYQRFIFENLPLAQTDDDYRSLLPKNLTNELLKIPGKFSGV